jgi:hypothetical protein
LKRFLKLMVTRRWGWTLIGALVLLTGILWGISSPTAPYIGLPEGSLQVFPAKNGDIYLYPTDKSVFFIARHDDFSPPIDANKIHMDILLDGVARPDMIRMNNVIRGNQPVTEAHVIEKLVLYNLDNKPLGTYIASDYDPNTGGYYENRWWPGAIALMAVGLLTASVALFMGHRPPPPPPPPL